MTLRLDELAKLASELGLEWRRVDESRLDVTVAPDVVLVFANLTEENDTVIGFEGTDWHCHDVVPVMIGDANYIQLSELDVLIGLGCGELVIISWYCRGELRHRSLAHKAEPLNLRQIEPGEEVRVTLLSVREPQR